jgi:hypothetical protein
LDRNKLIERAGKLLAMAKDTGSPAEAEIADRRLKALMEKHDISFAEIRRASGDPLPEHTRPQYPPVRRKRTRPNVRWRQPAAARRRYRIIASVAVGGFAAVLALWIFTTGVVDTGNSITETLTVTAGNTFSQRGPAVLNSQVDRATVVEGESLVLHITGGGISAMPDTSSLWQDFQITGTEVKESRDGREFHAQVRLQPRRTGTVIIPPFNVDGLRTEIIVIDVLERQ